MNSLKFRAIFTQSVVLVMTLTSFTGLFLSTYAHALEDQAHAVAVFSWIPSDRTRDENPSISQVERHNIRSISIELLSNGKYEMQVLMPADLTAGQSPIITLNEIARRPELSQFDFAGPQGKFTCTVRQSWLSAFCDVEFFNLAPQPSQSLAYLNNKYNGTHRIEGQNVLAQSFGAEPFGTIRCADPQAFVPGHEQGNGLWDTTYTDMSGGLQHAIATIDFDSGVYKVNGQNGILNGMQYNENLMEGDWIIGESEGWFKFRFEGSKFVGTWGLVDNPNVLGSWNGTRLRQ